MNDLDPMREQVYSDPRPKEYFDRFHERARTREPDWVYELVRVITSLYAWTLLRCRAISSDNVPGRGQVILAPNHFSFMDHFLMRCSTRRKVRFMAKSQLFKRPMQFIYTHGGVFPVRRGARDEETFITARKIMERQGAMAMYRGARRSCRSRSTAPRRSATGSGCSSRRSPFSPASRSAGRRSRTPAANSSRPS